MQIRYHCPTNDCVAIIEYEPLEESGPTMRCPRCSAEHAMTVTESIRREQRVDRCAVCGNGELFVRKDFPQRIGLAVVLIAGLGFFLAVRSNFLIAYGILAAAVLFDLALYLMIGKVTTCYACRAEYRKFEPNTAHEVFDLATSEKY